MTYSIVARDEETGEFGVAVQSHYFQVSPAVPWALAGVGAVATQSQVNISYGPLGLDLLQAGYTAEQALTALTSGDPLGDVRQCAIVDAAGGVAAHTGSKCIPAAGHELGDGFSCQANLMEKDTVWSAMAHAYRSSDAPLAERMMAALEAAEAEGGDIRGKQSAAMLVVTGSPKGRFWEDRIIDLRVEDAAAPLPELRRLLRIKRAYLTLSAADRLSDSGDKAASRAKAQEAIRIAPEMVEIRFWTGLEMAIDGDIDGGVELMSGVVREKGERWVETLRRLAMVDRVPADLAKTIEARLNAAVAPK
ncbi:MAG TPA: DUF1028 domain-containing protein [Candidatus Dormibacteraeota bacterium]|nr:DUF1028 domain-containing protein [Candidatus Dormibacteraeota bacterium]